jgi:hypothetical protein
MDIVIVGVNSWVSSWPALSSANTGFLRDIFYVRVPASKRWRILIEETG